MFLIILGFILGLLTHRYYPKLKSLAGRVGNKIEKSIDDVAND